MTAVKIDPKLSANASLGIEEHTGRLYSKPGMRILAVVELAHVERTQPAPDEDKEPSVKLGIKHLEVARGGRAEEAVRRALHALYTIRTASGTLDGDGEVQLSERTLGDTGGDVFAVSAARMQVASERWARYAAQVAANTQLTLEQLRNELRQISKGLGAAAAWSSDGD
jgi:hypothetical protein